MILLTRLNNQPLVVNSDLIKFVEQAPDTVITLVTGEKVLVRETAAQVMERIVEFRRSVLKGAMPFWERMLVRSPLPDEEEAGEDEER
ncbi:MAG TPA: flagellar FlbD family protein [Terriglobales bacterium]|nr:flagellar FlbD family protein [Terriglobales bacterium]